jgi:hypothetical protein
MNIKKISGLLRVTVIIVGLMFCCDAVFAQRYQGTLDFSVAYPQGDLELEIARKPLGMGLTFGVNLGKSPLILGVDLGILNYGRDTSDEFLYGDPEFDFEVIHSYNIFQGLAFLRFQLVNQGPLRPYLDGLVGINYFWTDTSIADDDLDEEVTIKVNHDDAAFTYGIGAGVMYKLGKQKRNRVKREEFFVDLRFRYIFGGKLEYLTKGSILVDEEEVTYFVSESRSDLYTFQIGFGMTF